MFQFLKPENWHQFGNKINLCVSRPQRLKNKTKKRQPFGNTLQGYIGKSPERGFRGLTRAVNPKIPTTFWNKKAGLRPLCIYLVKYNLVSRPCWSLTNKP